MGKTTLIEEKLRSTKDLVFEAFKRDIFSVLDSRSVYGNSWTHRRMIYFTDRIASKVMRIQNFENAMLLNTDGMEINRKGIEEELKDIVSYALFALIKIRWLKMDGSWIFRYFGAMKEDD